MNTETNYRTPYAVHRTLQKKLRFFSLIELLIVLAIIGALTALILPSFEFSEVEAKETVNTSESKTILKAFLNFYDDVVPSDSDLQTFANFGLTALMENNKPSDNSTYFSTWNPDRGKGWRGPYLSTEGRIDVDVTKEDGQSTTSGSLKPIPVVYNSYGGYYRVMIPVNQGGSTKLPAFLCLVNPGANGVVDLSKLEVVTATGEIVVTNQLDDEVTRLLPFY